MNTPARIDVHHGNVPAESVAALARIGITGGGGIPLALLPRLRDGAGGAGHA